MIKKTYINWLYDAIVAGLVDAAEVCITKSKCNFYKFWWNGNLKELKDKSCEAHRLWKDSGCPSSGDIFNIKTRAKANYKRALHQVNKENLCAVSNDLEECLLKKSLVFLENMEC